MRRDSSDLKRIIHGPG
uniref:Uncharacterized protein n=1 Tax=Lepeophtheirus salmonis TaxID=72036 RepID=A0A0K2VGB8_LEPSM